mmetsp:Transcript_88004/g.161103  ORF Transcript_88004/g.161103 Transcript_88004/m.161103 type:complete len:92 (+) Transcript_88004:1138-1413(+)
MELWLRSASVEAVAASAGGAAVREVFPSPHRQGIALQTTSNPLESGRILRAAKIAAGHQHLLKFHYRHVIPCKMSRKIMTGIVSLTELDAC